MILSTDQEIRALLERSKTVAVVGASPNPSRPSRGVFDALVHGGRFSASPVNPAASEIGGVPAFPTLIAIRSTRRKSRTKPSRPARKRSGFSSAS
jgi:predicted CoA-binding protein